MPPIIVFSHCREAVVVEPPPLPQRLLEVMRAMNVVHNVPCTLQDLPACWRTKLADGNYGFTGTPSHFNWCWGLHLFMNCFRPSKEDHKLVFHHEHSPRKLYEFGVTIAVMEQTSGIGPKGGSGAMSTCKSKE